MESAAQRRLAQNVDFAAQLARSGGFSAVRMGIFDQVNGFLLDHWCSHPEAQLPEGSCAISALTALLRQSLPPDMAATGSQRDGEPGAHRWLDTPDFLVCLGAPRGHLVPFVTACGEPGETGANKRDFLELGLAHVTGQLLDISSRPTSHQSRLLENALGALAIHFAVVDARGYIDYSANLSEDWMNRHGGFTIINRRLVARSRKVQASFQDLLAKTIAGERDTSFIAIRAENAPLRLAQVTALRQSSLPRAMVILGRGSEDAQLRDQLLKISGLTKAERRVAHHILRGSSLSETAEATNLAISTVRSYMKGILSKTGTHRQSEFIMRYQNALSQMWIATPGPRDGGKTLDS